MCVRVCVRACVCVNYLTRFNKNVTVRINFRWQMDNLSKCIPPLSRTRLRGTSRQISSTNCTINYTKVVNI